ncbi:hypothetical protein GCM10027269_11080 [Kribbella endophytica]
MPWVTRGRSGDVCGTSPPPYLGRGVGIGLLDGVGDCTTDLLRVEEFVGRDLRAAGRGGRGYSAGRPSTQVRTTSLEQKLRAEDMPIRGRACTTLDPGVDGMGARGRRRKGWNHQIPTLPEDLR